MGSKFGFGRPWWQVPQFTKRRSLSGFETRGSSVSLIADVMIAEPVTVGALADEAEVAEIVAHYNLLAVLVVDASGHLVGIVTVDDAMDAILPDAWRKRLPRLAGRS